MTTPCERYGGTKIGRRLAAIVNNPARYPEYCAFSREGFPAVTAIGSLVRPELERLRGDDGRAFQAAKQYVGWAVAQVMRAHGHKDIKRRRVPGGLIALGAIWSAEPTTKS
jgi:hypothetical protein